ncbi:MAG: peptidoglycan DD-metalloendopeptidase family protein [Paludibacteraceae bacterium]|nr:peptidoglycan DD-metalloendopeptidase family protein [Paludibacteraceae bacterium]MBQ5379091.1 peptidoglycan DD-metalloendopeptidase family protein [Paludibacteraceae bacterium]
MALKHFKYIVVLCLLSFVLCPVYAESVKELQAKQKKLQQEIEQTNKMLSQTKRDESATLNKLQLIERNIINQRELIKMLDSEITALDQEMSVLGSTRDSLQVVLEKHKAEYAEMIRQSHYARIQQSPLLFLLSSDGFQQLTRRARYLLEVAHYRQEQVRRIEDTQAEIDIQNELLQANKRDKQTALDTRKREQEKLKRDERKQQTMLQQLKTKEKDLKKKLQQQQKKVADLNKKIDEMVRKQTNSKTTLTKEQQLIAGGFEANKGRLPWPVEKGMISGHFGKQQHPVYSQVTIDNKGIYLQTVAGAKARAVYKGEVTSCFMIANTYAVIIQHGNYRTVYSNLSKLNVKQGDKVDTKQIIGTIFTDPEQDQKTELYFQIYKDRNILNPELWIAK